MKNFAINSKLLPTLFFVGIMLFSSSVFSQGIDFKQGNWDKIVAMAKAQKKPIFLDAYASWCGPCKWMDKNVYGESAAGDFYNATFISAKIDMEKGEGPALAKKYGVKAYPTLLFINADGSIEHRVCGSMELEAFIELGRTAIDPERRLKETAMQFQKSPKPEPENAERYFAMLDAGCADNTADVNSYFNKVQGEELMQDANWKLILNYVNDSKSTAFKELLERKTEFSEHFGADVVNTKIKTVYEASLETAARGKDTLAFNKLKTEVKKNVGDESEELILAAEMSKAKREGNWNSYASFANKYVEQYAGNDSGKLNEIAWNFYEKLNDKENLTRAEEYARRSVELKPGYGNLDTYAWLLYKNGKMSEAKETATRAIEMGRAEGADTSETETIFEKIK